VKEHSKYESNWLVIFLTTLVGVWVVPPVLGTLNRMLWSAVLPDAMQFGEAFPIWLLGRMITLGTIAAFILVITKLGKWNVLWPVFAGFLLVRLWEMIWPHLISLVHLIYALHDLGHRGSQWVWGVFPAVTALIYLAAATLTFVLVRRRGKALYNWLTTFLAMLVGVWLFNLVSTALLNAVRWLMFADNPWQWNQIANPIDVMVALASLAALVVVVHKLRKWPVLWPAPVFLLIALAWTYRVMPYLHGRFFSHAFFNEPFFLGDYFLYATWIVAPALYWVGAALTFILVRRHNKKEKAQLEPEQTMLT